MKNALPNNQIKEAKERLNISQQKSLTGEIIDRINRSTVQYD